MTQTVERITQMDLKYPEVLRGYLETEPSQRTGNQSRDYELKLL
jgi:hypothetical protein